MSRHKNKEKKNKSNNPFSNDNISVESNEELQQEIEAIAQNTETEVAETVTETEANPVAEIEEDDEVEYIDKDEEDEDIAVTEEQPEYTDSSDTEAKSEEQENKEEEKTEKKGGFFEGLFGNKKSDEELLKIKDAYDILNNQYLRLAADFENYRKRQESEREGLIKYGMEQALKKMIEIADNFSRAEKAMDTIDDCDKLKESFNALNKQFKDSLAKLGLEEIQAEGELFNPNLHEAVMQVPTDEKPEETIMQEMQKGYKYGNKVLRPSMVSVAVSK